VSLEVSGDAELLQAFNELDVEMQVQVREALDVWGHMVADYARFLARVRTGYMRSTVYAIVDMWQLDVGATAPYAVFNEFGTRYMSAQPFVYPALDKFLPDLEPLLGEAIAQAGTVSGFEVSEYGALE
jgi:HK97 gp10 family phage protein